MTEALELELVKKYPSFFEGYKGDPTKTCLAWGLAVGDGWNKIISDLCADIKAECDKDPDAAKSFKFAQVKEKWGQLCAYANGGNKAIWGLIVEAERKSAITCEQCGSTASDVTTKGSWLQTLCTECRDAYKRDPIEWKKD